MPKKPASCPYDLCNRVSEMLREAGFRVGYVSRKSEATYWELPGRRGYIRVAAHRDKRNAVGMTPVLARITFSPDMGMNGKKIQSDESVQNHVYRAVGRYFMKAPREENDVST